MAQLWSGLFARVRFVALGGRYESFVSRCAQAGIPLSRLRPVPGGVCGVMPARYYKQAAAQARPCRTRLRVRHRQGLWFRLRRYQGRWGLLLGPLAFAAVFVLMQQMVWSIRYDAALTPAQRSGIRQALYSMDIYEGAFLNQTRLRQAEKQLLNQNDGLAWVSLNFSGGRLVVEAAAAQPQPAVEENAYANLTALTDGLILEMNVQEGFAAKQPGQTVAAGEVLVTAGKKDYDGVLIPVHAKGTVQARFARSYQCTQPLEYQSRLPTGRVWSCFSLRAADRRLALPARQPVEADRCTTTHRPLTLLGFALPVTVEEQLVMERQSETVRLSEDQARDKARLACLRQLFRDFPDARILRQTEEVSADENSVTVTVILQVEANIAAAEQM